MCDLGIRYNLACAYSEDSKSVYASTVWPVFVFCLKKYLTIGLTQSTHQKLWSDCTDAQADLSLQLAHLYQLAYLLDMGSYSVSLSWIKEISTSEIYLWRMLEGAFFISKSWPELDMANNRALSRNSSIFIRLFGTGCSIAQSFTFLPWLSWSLRSPPEFNSFIRIFTFPE